MQREAAIHKGKILSRLAANEFTFYEVSNTKTLDSLASYLSREQRQRELGPSNLHDFSKAMNTPLAKTIQHYLNQHNSAIIDGPKGMSKIIMGRG